MIVHHHDGGDGDDDRGPYDVYMCDRDDDDYGCDELFVVVELG